MDKAYKHKFPSWCNSNKYHDLCLTDDIDSLLSCAFLKAIKGYNINYFYDFDAMYRTDKANINNAIGVDSDFINGKCWGNHVSLISPMDYYNPNAANINIIDKIHRGNYFHKYCGSTLLTILSYYNVDISNFSEEAKMILLAIDSTYKGYYSKFPRDNKANKYYLCDVLQFKELYELQTRHTEGDFRQLITKYSLNKKIMAYNGYLKTSIQLKALEDVFLMPIKLPDKEFRLVKRFKNVGKVITNYTTKEDLANKKIFSLALTNRNYVKYSIIA